MVVDNALIGQISEGGANRQLINCHVDSEQPQPSGNKKKRKP